MSTGRTTKSIRNIKYAIIGQAFGLLISFISRMVFVHTLSSEYLGINGLFSNILSVLSLADLGIGTSIIYSLYKPLAEKNQTKIKALMLLYKKSYTIIGVIVLILGLSITPFLDFFVNEMPNIPHIRLIFIIFVSNSAISYFLSYKRSLIIADQNRYIATLYRYTFYFALNIVQIIILLISHNYILYIVIQCLNTLLENILISRKADKLYPFIKEKGNEQLDTEEKNIIIRNVKATMLHKIGGVVVNGTDNLLISKLVSVIAVGLYSNYLLIISALNMVFSLIFQGVTASIGNLGATEKTDKATKIFNIMNFFGFWIYGFSSICLIALLNPFVKIWLGDEYLFPIPLILVIVLNYYITGMRKSVLTFRDAFGLYWYDRYKPLFESAINIGVSIILGVKFGTIGIFIGTAVSTLTTCFWVEPYILFKYGLKHSVFAYFRKYAQYTSILIIIGIFTYWFCQQIWIQGIMGLIFKLAVCCIIPNIFFLLLFYRTAEFKYLKEVFLLMFNKKSN